MGFHPYSLAIAKRFSHTGPWVFTLTPWPYPRGFRIQVHGFLPLLPGHTQEVFTYRSMGFHPYSLAIAKRFYRIGPWVFTLTPWPYPEGFHIQVHGFSPLLPGHTQKVFTYRSMGFHPYSLAVLCRLGSAGHGKPTASALPRPRPASSFFFPSVFFVVIIVTNIFLFVLLSLCHLRFPLPPFNNNHNHHHHNNNNDNNNNNNNGYLERLTRTDPKRVHVL